MIVIQFLKTTGISFKIGRCEDDMIYQDTECTSADISSIISKDDGWWGLGYFDQHAGKLDSVHSSLRLYVYNAIIVKMSDAFIIDKLCDYVLFQVDNSVC